MSTRRLCIHESPSTSLTRSRRTTSTRLMASVGSTAGNDRRSEITLPTLKHRFSQSRMDGRPPTSPTAASHEGVRELARSWHTTRSLHRRTLSVANRVTRESLDETYPPSHPGCRQPRPPPAPDCDHQEGHTWRDHECDGHASDPLHRDVLALRSQGGQGD